MQLVESTILLLRDRPFYFGGGEGVGNYQKKIPAQHK